MAVSKKKSRRSLKRGWPAIFLFAGLAASTVFGGAPEALPARAPANASALAANDPLARLVRQVRKEPEAFAYSRIASAVAREIYPERSAKRIARIEKDWDQLAAKLRQHLSGARGARETVARINRFIFHTLGLKTVRELLPEKEAPGYFFPHAVWKKKEGVCLGLSMVYLILCERTRTPVYPVHAPQHIYVRYDDGKEKMNIETTLRGRSFNEKSLMAQHGLSAAAVEAKKYFKPLGKLEVLGDLLNAAAWCSAIGTAKRPLPPDRAVLAGRLCVALGPRNYNNWDTLAQAQRYARQPKQALASLKKAIAMRPPEVGSYDRKYWRDRLRRFTEAAVGHAEEKVPAARP